MKKAKAENTLQVLQDLLHILYVLSKDSELVSDSVPIACQP